MSRRRNLPLTAAHGVRRILWRVLGPRTIGVRGVVIDDDGRVLLVRHSYGQSWWHLPGGGVKRRESLAEATLRELEEEVGVRVVGGVDGLEQFATYSNLAEGKSDHVTVFLVRRWSREDPSAGEIAESRFFSLDDLPDDVSPGTGRRLREVREGRPSSFRW